MKIFGYPIVFVDELGVGAVPARLGPPPVYLACPACGAGDYFFAGWPPAAGVEYRCGACGGVMSPPVRPGGAADV